MPINDFLPFAAAAGANVVTQEDYENAAYVTNGFTSGLARSAEINKAIRQSTVISSAVAQFIADNTGSDVLDNGNTADITALLKNAIGNLSGAHIAAGGGTADAITATFDPPLSALTNGLIVYVRATAENTSTTPTFNPDNLGALTIVKGANLPLKDGDIGGAGYWMILQYDQAFNKWILQNPAKGITPQSGVPVGTIEYFATSTSPAGYLVANGAAVGRTTYPDLFAAIGTTFGEGDGSTTFNLPDLIDRFAQGSSTPGLKIEAGLPNITGSFGDRQTGTSKNGCFYTTYGTITGSMADGVVTDRYIGFDAKLSNPTYGASDTVQPPALTLLPCIKAFDAATNPGLIDITELANDVADLSANKLDKMIDGTAIKYVTETYNDGTNWYRKWSDGWLEQGGVKQRETTTITLLKPFYNSSYCCQVTQNDIYTITLMITDLTTTSFTLTSKVTSGGAYTTFVAIWYACGQGAQS